MMGGGCPFPVSLVCPGQGDLACHPSSATSHPLPKPCPQPSPSSANRKRCRATKALSSVPSGWSPKLVAAERPTCRPPGGQVAKENSTNGGGEERPWMPTGRIMAGGGAVGGGGGALDLLPTCMHLPACIIIIITRPRTGNREISKKKNTTLSLSLPIPFVCTLT